MMRIKAQPMSRGDTHETKYPEKKKPICVAHGSIAVCAAALRAGTGNGPG